jgi:hypothetical protein
MQYFISFTDADGRDQTIEVDGFTAWRADAGFRSEAILDKPLKVFRAGKHVIKADEEGITSIDEMNVTPQPTPPA